MPPQFLGGVYIAPTINYTCLPPEGNASVVVSEYVKEVLLPRIYAIIIFMIMIQEKRCV